MKKLLYLFITSTFLISCSNLDDLYDEQIFNNTSFDIIIKNDTRFGNSDTKDFSYTIKAGETININTKNKLFPTAIITPQTNTERVFGIEFISNGWIINSYNAWVIYRVTGTAKKADLTYSTSSGSTGQRSSVTLPYDVVFKNQFMHDFLYISAQNDDEGSLKVEIFRKDKLKSSDQCSGFACIATAQATF
jgi:hypothetical protein